MKLPALSVQAVVQSGRATVKSSFTDRRQSVTGARVACAGQAGRQLRQAGAAGPREKQVLRTIGYLPCSLGLTLTSWRRRGDGGDQGWCVNCATL